MPQTFKEGRIQFGFPDDWLVCRPEKCSYYTKHFQRLAGSKEMDFILFEPDEKRLWLLEVKDYTTNKRSKQGDLFDEIAIKSRDSMALLLAGAVKDDVSNHGIGQFMATCLIPRSIRVILHLEQPSKPSKLFPGVKFKADASQMLRMKVGCLDSHATVVSTEDSHVPWTTVWRP